jgi:histidyl-tRNA synthetase
MQMGGRELAGVGFAVGIERVAGMLERLGLASAHAVEEKPDAWLVGLGEAAQEANLALMRELRAKGLRCRMAPGGSMKSQMRAANKSGARWAVIRGDEELAAGTAAVKNMESGEQRVVELGASLRDAVKSE